MGLTILFSSTMIINCGGATENTVLKDFLFLNEC